MPRNTVFKIPLIRKCEQSLPDNNKQWYRLVVINVRELET